MQDRSSNALLIAFCGLVSGLLLYTFYVSPLRERIEAKLFDIRTRLAPNLVDTSGIGIVAIDDLTTSALDGPDPSPPPKAAGKEPKPRNLSYESLLKVVRAAIATPADQIAVLIPNQIFNYDDPHARELAALAAKDERLLLGVFDLSIKAQSPDLLPEAFKKVQEKLGKADITRYYRREIVRDFVIKGDGELPFLPYLLATRSTPLNAERAAQAAHRQPDGKVSMKLNYFNPSLLRTIKAEELVRGAATNTLPTGLEGRTLFIGYTTYRPWTPHDREATFVNSPWQVDGNEVDDGIPVVHVQAIALANITRGIWMRTAPTAVVALQALLLTALTLVFWKFSVGFASFLFIGGWSCVLLLHALLFAFANQYVPLADAALFSSLAMVGGALSRLRTEGRLRAEHEAVARSEAELAQIQERFLDRFAAELQTINAQASARLEAAAECKARPGPAREAYVRALGSCEELDDYLRGIQQFARLGAKELAKPPLQRVDALAAVQKVVRQFESRAEEAKVRIVVAESWAGTALADPTLLAQILYNLVSNAVKYSPPGGTVHIALGPAGPQRLAITVRDEGPGIAPEFHERIFEKFYRVKDDYVYKLKGHGLGLFLSRFFADQIGASIQLESSPGNGACFTLTSRSA